MAETVAVSIIIVNYNAGELLPRCLESVLAQTFQDFEVLVIDNNSKDSSLDQVPASGKISVHRNTENLGFAKAQNQGMRIARGKYLMPLNFDIQMTPTLLEEMVKTIETDSRVGTVSGKLLRMDSSHRPTQLIDNAGLLLPTNRFPCHRGGGEEDHGQYDSPVRVFGAMGAAALYRRDMLDDIAYEGQYFDESYFMWYEDIDLDWRGRLRGWECLYNPCAVAYHIGDPHGHGKSPFGAKTSMRNRWMMILADECGTCLLRNLGKLLIEELKLLRHVVRSGLVGMYLRALFSFIQLLPVVLKKRKWVRRRATISCLPDYPLPYMT